ncbi:MAG: DNA methyltransferase, partial [Chrysiogenales bacterium]
MKQKSIDFFSFVQSVFDYRPVNGFTHTYYRYPARFSPKFAEAAIKYFTKPGETVYDPFMGGGTTLVEAMRLGRRSIGTDINSLAVFVSKVKTTLLSDNDIYAVHKWVNYLNSNRKLNGILERPSDWISQGYQKNINSQKT